MRLDTRQTSFDTTIALTRSISQGCGVECIPKNGTVSTLVRDPCIGWVNVLAILGNWLYFTENQNWHSPQESGGVV